MGTDRERWLEERRTGIGGSDVAAILGISPWKTPLQVYEEKLGLAPATEENEAMKWGTLLEPIVMAEFSRRTGKTVIPGGTQIIRHRDMPWMTCTPDGLISGREADEGLECKTARSAHGWGEPEGDDVPPIYLCQVTQCMIVTGRPVWWVAVLIGGSDFRIRRVELDAVLANEIIQSCADFWRHHIEKRIPPAAQSAEEARRKWPTPIAGAVAQASQDIIEAARRLATLKAEAKTIEEHIEAEQSRIMDAMGTAEALKNGNQLIATWKASETNRLDTKALKAAHPLVAKQFTKTTVSRRFLLKGEE